MDPIENLVGDVLPNIFQHFSVREILQFCLVSKSWNQAIGKSECTKKNIWLRFYEPIEDVNSLMISTRKYQNFKMQRRLKKAVEKLLGRFDWKSVILRDILREDDVENYVNLMKVLAPRVENIEWWNITSRLEMDPLSFPKLKNLKIHFVPDSTNAFVMFLVKLPRLESLIISKDHSFIEDSIVLDMIYQLLKLNQQVKHLSFDSNLNIFFRDIAKEMNVQLESFKVPGRIEERYEENLVNFVKSQENLEKITIQYENADSWHLLSRLWKSMERCKTFELLNIKSDFIPDLCVKKGITKLSITGKTRFVHSLLNATPNLVILRTEILTDEILTFSVYSLKDLRVIEYLNQDCQLEAYEQLKQSKMEINKKILIQKQTIKDFLREQNN